MHPAPIVLRPQQAGEAGSQLETSACIRHDQMATLATMTTGSVWAGYTCGFSMIFLSLLIALLDVGMVRAAGVSNFQGRLMQTAQYSSTPAHGLVATTSRGEKRRRARFFLGSG